MRISEKIEVDYEDDFFAGCEMENELFAVIVGGLGHDDEEAASRVGPRGEGEGAASEKKMHTYPPHPRVCMYFLRFACGDASEFVSQAESAPNRSGKGMRIGAKIEVDYDDDSFVGFERSSKLFAVVVGGLGHDHRAVAEKIQ